MNAQVTANLRAEFEALFPVSKGSDGEYLPPWPIAFTAYCSGRSLSAADAKDAERYRWLRSDEDYSLVGCTTAEIEALSIFTMDEQTARLKVGAELDAAIDAALASDSAGGRKG